MSLYCFLVGINGLSTAIKHMGGDFAENILTTTSNPFIALFIGILSTTIFQSSSTTTSLIVGMVSGGALNLAGAIPMIMGANIGTTVTNIIVSIGHINRGNEFKRAFAAATVHDFFNVFAVLILFPIEIAFGLLEKTATGLGTLLFGSVSANEVFKSPIKTAIKWGTNQLESISFDSSVIFIIISVLLTLAMLFSIVKFLRSLVLDNVQKFFDRFIFKTAIRGILFGMLLTIMVQSSSITTSTIVPLAGAGVLTLRQIYPFTLGANIGTTVTAILAALTLNVTALVAAFAHLFFNLYGILIIYANPLFREIPLKLANWLSEVAIKNKFIPLIYLVCFFFLLPFIIIILGR
ncbi:MAG: Na/Pi symporter [Candidatus Neomarinimicrobiota bacterium]|nr:Na/Pi symporter [Candidatus Neomarinimicrobiota bacterium]MEE1506065.1 Na/Pi symporter [Candidatus Neomarinimicrobiota bacterium]